MKSKKTYKNICGVYLIQNNKNKRKYIGSSYDITRRWKRHISCLRRRSHKNYNLQNDWDRFKESDFNFSIIHTCEREELLDKEQGYIDLLDKKTCYNISFKAGSGGFEQGKKAIRVLYLGGQIYGDYECGADFAIEIGIRNIPYSIINTKKTTKITVKEDTFRVRIVHTEFYEKNLELIKSWPAYTNTTEYNKRIKKFYKIILNGKIVKEFKTMRECGEFMGLSRERIRQIIKEEKKHKKTGYQIVPIVYNGNDYV